VICRLERVFIEKIFSTILLLVLSVPLGYAASKTPNILKSSETLTNLEQQQKADRFRNRLQRINSLAVSEKKETQEDLAELGSKTQNDIKDIDVDQDLLNAARDKSLDWKTRYLLIEHVNVGSTKKITKDKELTLYSDALSDTQEHNEVRKLAAQSLMEPARTEPKARAALAKAAKDKTMPADVLWSVMVSVGSSGIDDVDTLTGLMNREPKTNNDIGINLNAVRALGQSKDPRALGMLFKILDESKPDSFFNVTALEQLGWMNKDPEKQKELRPMLAPRLLKLLDDRGSHIGASRQMAGRMLLRMRERKAIPQVIKWLKHKEEGGGYAGDVIWAADILAEFQAKEAIPEIQKVLDNFATDSRQVAAKRVMEAHGDHTFPKGAHDYIVIQECLKKLKGEPYDKKYVSLPWNYE